MTKANTLRHVFVDHIPERLEEGMLYVSIPFATVVHQCCCGCGSEVVTPLSPTDWSLTFDGQSVSLAPSIGNWNFPCQSHYWVVRGRVRWAERWTPGQIQAGRERDRFQKPRYFDDLDQPGSDASAEETSAAPAEHAWSWIERVKGWLRRIRRSREA